jgi:uncharacterized membrane protein YecN with MAPEG domain
MPFIPSITILYAGVFGLLLLVLSLNIFREYISTATGSNPESNERWRRAERAQHSFVEFVPMCLLIFFLIEAHGAPALVLHGLGILLLTARVLHAYGVGRGSVADVMRQIGTQTTYLTLMISSLAAIYYAIMPMIMSKA